jgi:hypothetical protein
MKKPEMPSVFQDVYRDLRDRRLLIVVAGLIVAIVAIPFALAKKPETNVPVPTPNGSTAGGNMTVPAVTLADQPGITNYRKRLARFETQNPFKAQFVVKSTSASGAGSGSSSSPFSSSSSSPSSAPPVTGGGTPPPASTASTPPTTTTGEAPPPSSGNGSGGGGNGGGGNGSGGPTKPTIKTVTQLFTRRVDLTISKDGGKQRNLNGVEPMTIIPNEDNPALAFLGTDEKGKNAAFVLSSRSLATGGNASCVPSPDNCIYVTMQEGDTLTVDYTPEGATTPVTYQLTLNKIRDVDVSEPKKAAHPAQAPAYASTGENGG